MYELLEEVEVALIKKIPIPDELNSIYSSSYSSQNEIGAFPLAKGFINSLWSCFDPQRGGLSS
jgi:hypothetical protein